MRQRLDPAWLTAQYDNRARVSDFARHLQRWAEASALARTAAGAQLDVAYGSGEKETLDIFPASATTAASHGPVPVLVFIHGGYWRALDKSDFSFVAPAFNAAGAAVVVPNYALCPAVDIEHICLQVARAVAWVWRNAAAQGWDAARIALAGHSAGGHLVSMLLACRWKELAEDLPAQPVTGALSISGLFDLEPVRHTPFLQTDLKLTPASVARVSPAFFPRPKGPKLYATVGLEESDEFLRQNKLIRDQWGPTAVPVCETLPGHNHFSVVQTLADPTSRLHELALRLLGLR
jgi:arylformamidase